MKKLVIKDITTIRRKVYLYLREQILSGEIGPHQRLIEAKIAKEIGTSRTPVREALHNARNGRPSGVDTKSRLQG